MAHTAQVLTPGRELRLVGGSGRTYLRAVGPTSDGVVSVTSVAAPARPAAPSTEGSLRDLRLTRRGWWVLSILAIALVALGMTLGGRAFASDPVAPVAVAEHYVSAGETLWQIAGRVAAPGEDVRDVVDMLVDLNGRSSASLQVGERILVPAP